MQDGIQRAVQALAYSDGFTRAATVICAVVLVFVLAAGWLFIAYRRRAELTLATGMRIAVLFVAAYLIAKGLGHLIHDPRPYLVENLQPVIPLAHDNGFPSDHSLLAWALALSLAWLAPTAVPAFIVGAVLVMLGRLGVAAHHTLDVAGSAAIVIAVTAALSLLPLPAGWYRPLLSPAARRRAIQAR